MEVRNFFRSWHSNYDSIKKEYFLNRDPEKDPPLGKEGPKTKGRQERTSRAKEGLETKVERITR